MINKTGKSSTRAKNKYNAINYDSVHLFMPKGYKSEILAAAEVAGDSLNGYITKTVYDRIGKLNENAVKTYTIIGGVNGTGKSSFTGVLKSQAANLGTIIDVDMITIEAGVTPIEGGKIALRKINNCLEQNVSFTQETTLSGHRTSTTAKKAKALGYQVRLFYIALDTMDECLHRIENRVARGGHNIDKTAVVRRFAGQWDSVKRILTYCDEAHFFGNDNGFVEVAEYKENKLTIKSNQTPLWVQNLNSIF